MTALVDPQADGLVERPLIDNLDDGRATSACAQMGIPIHQYDMVGALDRIRQLVEIGRVSGRSHQVVTVNADFLVTARHHGDVHAILRGADLLLADGMPLVWASSSLGVPLPERVAGADLVPALAGVAAANGYRMLLFGGLEHSADRSAQILRERHPRLIVEGMDFRVGPRGETAPADLAAISAFAPDIICVALGHPKQERWIRAHGQNLGIPVAIGVGGTLDFIANQRKRAPKWIGKIGLEWLFRLAQEPKRLTRRYVDDFTVFIPAMARQITLMSFADQFRRTEARVQVRPDRYPAISLSDGRIGRRTAKELSSAASALRHAGITPSMALPSYRQTRALRRERLDRMFLFVSDEHWEQRFTDFPDTGDFVA